MMPVARRTLVSIKETGSVSSRKGGASYKKLFLIKSAVGEKNCPRKRLLRRLPRQYITNVHMHINSVAGAANNVKSMYYVCMYIAH